jgi:hypothetical protein
MKYIALLILVTVVIDLRGQEEYVVTLKNDTLRGPVRLLTYDVMDRVAVGSGSKKTSLKAVEVRYVVQDGFTYQPVQNNKAIRFMRVLRAGYLTLYAYRQEFQSSYDSRLLLKMNGQKIDLPNIGFKKLLSEFLEDCPATALKVKEGEFDRSEVEAIVDDYNACVAAQNNVAIVTAKPTPLVEAISALRAKVETSSLESKQEVLDLIKDLDNKAKRGQTIPAYLASSLKSYLGDKKEFEEQLNNLLSLLNP